MKRTHATRWTPCWLMAMSLLLLPIPWFRHTEASRSWGGISRVVVNRLLVRDPRAKSLAQVDFRNFLYHLYPTPAADIGNSRTPLIPAGLRLQVEDGEYSHRNGDHPLDFRLYRTQLVKLPRAPGGVAELTFGILFHGRRSRTCAGVVQEYEWRTGKLALLDQFTYNCHGGGSAQFLAAKRQLRIKSAHYALGDQLCCPSLDDQVDFVLDGIRAQARNIQTTE